MAKAISKRMATCWHEAGHAVALLVQGLDVVEVSIVAAADYAGSCVHPSLLMYDVTSARMRKSHARACIISSYAGIEAERLYDRDAPDWHAQYDWEDAFDTSREYGVLPRTCSSIGDDDHLTFLGRLQREAKRLVKQHEPKIRKLAVALSKSRTLSGEQVRVLLEYD